MIKLMVFDNKNNGVSEHIIKSTRFPDGTSQVWKIPGHFLEHDDFKIVWSFEEEREIIDIMSLVTLLPYHSSKHLHIPYLPYGRQDKEISNNSTFNLKVFGNMINTLELDSVTSVDVHNSNNTLLAIENFKNIDVSDIHLDILNKLKPTNVVFPDKGAKNRYHNIKNALYCKKIRNQLTGTIESVKVITNKSISPGQSFLIIDDICDGGATFVSIAKALREIEPNITINLFVTHGIFSKGKKLEGIDEVFTTNSLIKNTITPYEV